jgi:hypothetical protein
MLHGNLLLYDLGDSIKGYPGLIQLFTEMNECGTIFDEAFGNTVHGRIR